MLKALRWKLTFFYFATALCLIALVGGGAYWLLSRYFQQTTDMALQYRMIQELNRYGVQIPAEMISATIRWCEQNQLPTPITGIELDESLSEQWEENEFFEDEAYNADLATIFIFPLDQDGTLLFDPNPVSPRMNPDLTAVHDAIENGCDWRTVNLDDGRKVRLFTFALPPTMSPQILQAGRFMENTRSVLRTLMIGIISLAGFSMLVLGFGAWFLAGRSLKPAQLAFDQQQAFIANASHELRAPLTIIRATAEVTLRHAETEKQKSLLTSLMEETDHMASLVEDLLLLSRLDAGKLRIEKAAIPMAELLNSIIPSIGVIMEKEGINLSVESTVPTIYGDRTRLRQVLLIILINAVHHTPAGGEIRISALRKQQTIQIIVTDNGEGISREHLPHIFERFYQADSTMNQIHKGAGLGLSIARGLIEAHGGTIQITSEYGHGTQVWIELPDMNH